ncbi:MAG: hypothetical protein SFZ03_12410 [Candidatus Melainabacteria bacterium]|nr:hypothetical protein [Candidatus Melainabacteria bacterium]
MSRLFLLVPMAGMLGLMLALILQLPTWATLQENLSSDAEPNPSNSTLLLAEDSSQGDNEVEEEIIRDYGTDYDEGRLSEMEGEEKNSDNHSED